jgi:hypothetical protein
MLLRLSSPQVGGGLVYLIRKKKARKARRAKEGRKVARKARRGRREDGVKEERKPAGRVERATVGPTGSAIRKSHWEGKLAAIKRTLEYTNT